MTPGFQPQSDPPSCRKQGSRGWGLGKLGGGANLPDGQEAGDLEKEEASAVTGWEEATNPAITVIKSWQDKLCHTRHTGVCG